MITLRSSVIYRSFMGWDNINVKLCGALQPEDNNICNPRVYLLLFMRSRDREDILTRLFSKNRSLFV